MGTRGTEERLSFRLIANVTGAWQDGDIDT